MIIETNNLLHLPSILQLRIDAWAPDGVLPPGDVDATSPNDEHDEHARHWVVIEENRIIAAARLCTHECSSKIPDASLYPLALSQYPGPLGSLNRLAVSPEARGRGLWRELARIRLEAAIAMGCRTIVSCTQANKTHVLESLGFIRASSFDVSFTSATSAQKRVVPCVLLIFSS